MSEIEVFQRDPPKKSHIVAERIDKSTIKTVCGLKFEAPNGMTVHTFTYDPETPQFERTYNPPPPEGRCGNCPWDE